MTILVPTFEVAARFSILCRYRFEKIARQIEDLFSFSHPKSYRVTRSAVRNFPPQVLKLSSFYSQEVVANLTSLFGAFSTLKS